MSHPPRWPEGYCLRLRRRLEDRACPLLYLWSWPGSGAELLFSNLVASRLAAPLKPGGAAPLPKQQRAAARRGLVWLLAPPSFAREPAVLEGLGAEVPVLVVGREQPAERAALGPADWLLGPREVRGLWSKVAGRPLGAESAARLVAATDGWLRPLELAAEADRTGRAAGDSAAALAALDSVASFLETEVLAGLGEAARDLLVELSLPETIEPELWQETLAGRPAGARAFETLRRQGWLLVSEGGAPRLPALLRAHLEASRGRSWSPARRAAAHRRLGLACYSLERPAEALSWLAAAGDGERVGRLLKADWEALLTAAPAALLRSAPARSALTRSAPARFAPTRSSGSGAGLLSRGVELLRDAAVLALEELAAFTAQAREVARLAAPPGLAPGSPVARGLDALEALALSEGSGEESESALAPALSALPRPPPAGLEEAALLPALLACVLRRLCADSAPAREAAGKSPWRDLLLAGSGGGPAEPAPGYRLRLFGTFAVFRLADGGDYEEVRFSLKRAAKLLAYLVSAPEMRSSKAELVESLWPDEDGAAIRRNFHPTLSHLRRGLTAGGRVGKPVRFRNEAYFLDPAAGWEVDIVTFAHEVEKGRQARRAGRAERAVEHWHKAWALHRGGYLQGLYDPWVVERREALHRTYLGLLRDLGEAFLELGLADEALDAFRALLVEDPLEESAQVAIMRLYAAQGRRDLVRRQYDRLRSLLLRDLGVEPLPQTSAEYHRLMA